MRGDYVYDIGSKLVEPVEVKLVRVGSHNPVSEHFLAIVFCAVEAVVSAEALPVNQSSLCCFIEEVLDARLASAFTQRRGHRVQVLVNMYVRLVALDFNRICLPS